MGLYRNIEGLSSIQPRTPWLVDILPQTAFKEFKREDPRECLLKALYSLDTNLNRPAPEFPYTIDDLVRSTTHLTAFHGFTKTPNKGRFSGFDYK